jgi:hypothetical protein
VRLLQAWRSLSLIPRHGCRWGMRSLMAGPHAYHGRSTLRRRCRSAAMTISASPTSHRHNQRGTPSGEIGSDFLEDNLGLDVLDA